MCELTKMNLTPRVLKSVKSPECYGLDAMMDGASITSPFTNIDYLNQDQY